MAQQPVFELEGYKEFVKSLKDLPKDIRKELTAVIGEAVGTVRDMAVGNIPHNTETSRYANGSRGGVARQPGGLAAGITTSRSGTAGKVQSAADYARIVEFGSHVTRTSRGKGSTSYALSALSSVPTPQKGRDLLAAGWDAREKYGPELTERVMRLMERAFDIERGG